MKKIFTLLSIVTLGIAANAQIVINEVFGGGGGSGATLKNDFVELINNGNSTVTLSGAFLQYGSATSTTAITASNIQALPDIILNPGQIFLIQEASGTGGTVNLPTPDFAPATTLNFGQSAGKLFLTSNNTSVAAAGQSNIIDSVSWGTGAVWSETSPAPATSVTTSISRASGGVDTNNNSVDFTAGTPTPTNSSGQTLAVGEISKSKINLVKNTIVKDVVTFGAKANVQVVNLNGQVLKSTSVDNGDSLDISSLSKGVYIIKGEVNGESVAQKIIKQ